MNGTIAIATIQAAKQWSLNRGGGVLARRSASNRLVRGTKRVRGGRVIALSAFAEARRCRPRRRAGLVVGRVMGDARATTDDAIEIVL
jgi:hypothetical protein